jgi:putative ABC transport system permease protein
MFYLPLLDPGAEGDKLPLFTILARGRSGAEGLAASVKAAIREADPEMPLKQVRPFDNLLTEDRRASRARSALFAVFAGMALLLASVGIYGVTSTLVAQRTREIGIRMALGAQVKDVLRLIMAHGFRTIGIGVALGLAATFALGRLIQSQLMGLSPLDPATYAAVLGLLVLVALAATLIPALRAAKVDPAVALRSE